MLEQIFPYLQKPNTNPVPMPVRKRPITPDPNFPGIGYGNNSPIESGFNQVIPIVPGSNPPTPAPAFPANPAPTPMIQALGQSVENRPIPLTQRLAMIQANMGNRQTSQNPLVVAQGGKIIPSRFGQRY